MVRRSLSSTILILGLALLGGQPAEANTPLTRAVVSSLRNQVRLLPRSRPARKAKLSDVLIPGDGIVTSRRSLAELRFNDGSLARMGEQAVFRFIPKTRSFRLSNGTVLMLIPPGQGRTQVRTPNVTAGIRGSALIIRYDQVTDTSTVIALTNSQISATNRDSTQTQVLAAGQAVVVVGDEITESYDVDLQELYRTSSLLQDLEMDNPDASVKDEAIAQVREETLEGIRSQRSFTEDEGRDATEDLRLSELNVDSVVANETGRPFGTAVPVLYTDVEFNSSSFPGQAIGVDGRFIRNDENAGEGNIARPGFPQPSVIDLPAPSAVETPAFGQPAASEQPPVPEPLFTEPPVAADQPPVFENPVESPVADDSVAGGVMDDVGDSVIDSSPVDDPLAETPLDDAGDLAGGDGLVDDVGSDVVGDVGGDIGNDITGDIGNDVAGDLGGDVVGDIGSDLAGDMGGDVGGDIGNDVVGDIGGDVGGDLGGDVAGDVGGDLGNDLGGDIGGGDIAGDLGTSDPIDDAGLLPDGVPGLEGDDVAGGGDVGGDDIAGDLGTSDPIDDAGLLPDGVPALDDTTDTLMPDNDPVGDQVADSPGGVGIDINADVTITVIINGEPTVIQNGTTADVMDASIGDTSPIDNAVPEENQQGDGLIDLQN